MCGVPGKLHNGLRYLLVFAISKQHIIMLFQNNIHVISNKDILAQSSMYAIAKEPKKNKQHTCHFKTT